MATRSTPRDPAKSLQSIPLIRLTAAAEAAQHAVDEAIAVLESAGETSAALVLRREFGRFGANHVCTFSDDRCACGASR